MSGATRVRVISIFYFNESQGLIHRDIGHAHQRNGMLLTQETKKCAERRASVRQFAFHECSGFRDRGKEIQTNALGAAVRGIVPLHTHTEKSEV